MAEIIISAVSLQAHVQVRDIIQDPAPIMLLAPILQATVQLLSPQGLPQFAAPPLQNPLLVVQAPLQAQAPSLFVHLSSQLKSRRCPTCQEPLTGAGVQRRWQGEERVQKKARILRHLLEWRMLVLCPWCHGVVRPQPTLPPSPCPTSWASSTCRVRLGWKEEGRRLEKREKETCWWPYARGSSSREPAPTIALLHALRDDTIATHRRRSQETCDVLWLTCGAPIVIFVNEVKGFTNSVADRNGRYRILRYNEKSLTPVLHFSLCKFSSLRISHFWSHP